MWIKKKITRIVESFRTCGRYLWVTISWKCELFQWLMILCNFISMFSKWVIKRKHYDFITFYTIITDVKNYNHCEKNAITYSDSYNRYFTSTIKNYKQRSTFWIKSQSVIRILTLYNLFSVLRNVILYFVWNYMSFLRTFTWYSSARVRAYLLNFHWHFERDYQIVITFKMTEFLKM